MLSKMSPMFVTLFLILSLHTDSGTSSRTIKYTASLAADLSSLPIDSPIISPGKALDTYLDQKKTIEKNILKAKIENEVLAKQQKAIDKQLDSISVKIDSMDEIGVKDSVVGPRRKTLLFQWIDNMFNKKNK